MELACDEKVIKKYDDTQKKAYALTTSSYLRGNNPYVVRGYYINNEKISKGNWGVGLCIAIIF